MRTIFIGDIHGCSQEFRGLLDKLEYDASADRLFLTGDNFARGPDPAGTLDLIRESRAQSVLGNHDWKIMRCIEHQRKGAHPDDKFSPSQTLTVERMNGRAAELLEYIGSLPFSIISARWTLVHAGVHPELGPAGTDIRAALTIRTFPDYDNPDLPHWYDLYQGKKLIIFGHDARGGLVRREKDGRPIAIGLDTGCVYGGKLSAYILEEDQIVQLPAKRMYYDPEKKKHLFL